MEVCAPTKPHHFDHISNPNNRHIRLKKNFVNRETIPHVGVKLRIPEVLLVEKMRTQQRFNVSGDFAGARYTLRFNNPYINHPPPPQVRALVGAGCWWRSLRVHRLR